MIKLILPKIDKYPDCSSEIIINGADNTFMGKLLKREGFANYEPHTIATILQLLERSESKVFFDIGCNIGIYSFSVAALFGNQVTIRAFEPMPNLASIATQISQDNNLSYKVEEMAMGSSSGNAILYVSQKSDTSNSLLQGFRPSKQELSVRVETIDAYVKSNGLIPSVIKIDTEATEPDVISGATEVLSKNRPWIICEVLKGRTEEKLQLVMEQYGYYYYHITDEKSWIPSEKIVGDPSYKLRDWLFAPEKIDQKLVDNIHMWVSLAKQATS
ncbi:MAG: FkbM family methyltransferase [Xenococcus sp. (in: cyanobacteria)]